MFKLVSLLLFAQIVHISESIWVNEDFWTTVSATNILSAGRTVADFARLDNDNIFPALWITRTRYLPRTDHFESFGYAFIRPDSRVCGWFAGLRGEAVEVCGGFRVLSVPERFRGQKVFDWVPAAYARDEDTVGFSSHRIAKRIDAAGNLTYGDAVTAFRSFLGVHEGELVNEKEREFFSRVSLLRLLVDPRKEDNLRDARVPETASVPAPTSSSEGMALASAVRMYIPVEIVRNERGEVFERKLVDGRLFYFPFDIAEKRALTLQQIMEQHRAHKKLAMRRRRELTEAKSSEILA